MEKTVDLSLSTEYDLVVDKDRTLNTKIYCYYYTGTTCVEQLFDFTFYSGATMTVKNSSGTVVQSFSTLDGSIVLEVGGVLRLVKTSDEMDKVRAGEYKYDLYLSNATYPKRGFLRGKINYIQNIAY